MTKNRVYRWVRNLGLISMLGAVVPFLPAELPKAEASTPIATHPLDAEPVAPSTEAALFAPYYVKMTITPDSLRVGDSTLATAVPFLSSNRVSDNAVVRWFVDPPANITVHVKDTYGHVAYLVGTSAALAPTKVSVLWKVVVSGITQSFRDTDSLRIWASPGQPPVVTTVAVGMASSIATGQVTQASATVRDQYGNIMAGQTVSWASTNTDIATVSVSGLVTGIAAGAAGIRATVGTVVGNASISVITTVVTDTLPEQPRTLLTTTVASTPSAGRTLAVTGTIQAAIDSAIPGDNITLTASATYPENLTLRSKVGGIAGGYITIKTTGCGTLPAENTRIRPTTASCLAKIVSPNVDAAIITNGPAARYRFIGVEVTATPQGGGVDYMYGLIRIGGDQTTQAQVPRWIIFDRCYIHGRGGVTGGSNVSVQHGIVMNGDSLAVVDSWIEDIHWPGTETHGIASYAANGPFKIVNNYIEAASINILFGGAYGNIATATPSDIEIKHNHLYKPTTYFSAGYAVKNILECKHCQRMLVEGNILENSWVDAQAGYAINMQSGGDSGPLGTVLTSDLTFRYNIIRNAPIGLDLVANPYQSSVPVTRVTFEHNLFTEIGPFGPVDVTAIGLQILDNISWVKISHNTLVRTSHGGAPFFVGHEVTVPPATHIKLLDNIMGVGNPYGSIFASGGYVGTLAMNHWATSSSATGWTVLKNVFWQAAEAPPDARAIPGNYWPVSQTAVGFNGDYSLNVSSPYKNLATDGSDPGPNITTLTSLTSGVIVVR